ncbi:HEAT repeat domain-containing protein [Persicimonas caeni]|uniref:HEAT repeat domain-containing protein n=1 Tax=Persicimonas caeni TaxID=2292766 RepID=A0A4Y6PRL7_PERCE|nr:HEAT repeat domain-containing protein [Persicimonas caeni]QDG50966.1 HEAT repeat domain-containing protein [Persicimonas caeni]QED32187.1 HEAT repeat domain-containing protein [Persicimonas caeni]
MKSAGVVKRACAIAGIVMLGMGLLGCEEEKFGEAERQEVQRVLHTGVGLDSDPYVQAETLRVFEMIKKPELNEFAEKLVDSSDSPMVRVAALRVLLANDYQDIRRVATASFNKGSVAEKKAILSAVLEYGPPPLKRVITSRALRSTDPFLRRQAFEEGPLARLEKAQEEGKAKLLENTLFPEIGRSINHDDEVLASAALEALVAAGQTERAEPLLETLGDKSAEREKRLSAARILGRAQIKEAVPHFEKILESVKVSKTGEFVLPKKIDEELVKAATLGLVAAGETKYVKQAQKYLTNADVEQSLEVLTALAPNPSEDAAISLKIAMQDAREPVRYRAIELFADHDQATAKAFMAAMRGTDFESKKRLAQILTRRFPGEWAKNLSKQLDNEEQRLATLELLRDVIVTTEDAQTLEPLSDQLYKLAKGKDEKASALAALLLVKVADDQKSRALLAEVDSPEIRYAYLEHLVRTAPKTNVEFFRKNFYADLYALRLMSAAGMMLAYDAGVAPGQTGEEGEGL